MGSKHESIMVKILTSLVGTEFSIGPEITRLW